MRMIKPLVALLLSCMLYLAHAGNACFGTYTIHSSIASNSNLSVRFESQYVLASGWSIVNETWNFGDGTTATGTAVTHAYAAAGQSYNACLIATAYNASLNVTCKDTLCKTVTTCNSGDINSSSYFYNNVQADGVMYANISVWSNNAAVYPLSAYADYGDGTQTSVYTASSGYLLGNLNHVYTTADTFVVNLYVTNAAGCVFDSSYIIKVASLCSATATFTTQVNGDTVQFFPVANSTNGIQYYDWTFYTPSGFHAESSLQSPTIIYAGPGPYYARLLVHDSLSYYYCTDTLTQQVYPVVPPCNTHAAFSFSNVGGNTYQFTNLSNSLHGYASVWLFRVQGATVASSSLANPQYTYTSAGTLSATLRVTDSLGVCTDTLYQVLAVGSCDTFTNIISSDVPTLYMVNSNGGYATGNNSYGDKAFVEELAIGTGYTVSSIKVGLGKVKAVTSSSVMFALWDNTGPVGSPGNIIASSYVNIQTLKNIAASSNPFVDIAFTNAPIINSGVVYAGVVLPTTVGDTVALFTTSSSSTGTGRGWLQYSDNTWHDYSTTGISNLRNFISAYACSSCSVSANYTYTTSNDTVTLINASSPLAAIASYDVTIKYVSSGVLYASNSGAFNSINKFKIPQDTLMSVCLVAHDTSASCTSTYCNTIGTWQPCTVNANFTFTQTGSAILLYNNSTGNFPPLTYQWQSPGGWPASSTATDTSVFYPQQGAHQICLIATNALGCKDTFCTSINIVPTDTLCGMVFNDANNNGIFDGGEQVRPNSAVNINGTVFYTDNTGFYRVPVVSGSHVITLLAPFGWVQTYPDTPLVYNVTTSAGNYLCGLDFGMRDDTLVLSGIAYIDNNGNGLYDTGDQPRVNVPITISGINGNSIVYTNTQGKYSKYVYSGTYTISAPVPAGSASTQPLNNNSYTITAYITSITGLNFGVRDTSVTISGRVYVDANGNGAYDTGETFIGGQPVHVGSTTVYTNSSGIYSVVKPAGTYAITYSPTGNYTAYNSCTPSSITLAATTAGTNYNNNNFGICIAPGTGDVCIVLSPVTTVTPALGLAKYKISLQNYGNTPMNGTLTMNFDPLLTYQSATVAPASVSGSTYTITWQVAVNIGQTVVIIPSFSVPSTAVVGTHVFNYAFYNPAAGFTDVNMACNEDTLHQQVVASYDPNDKFVSPLGTGNNHVIRNTGLSLDYTIMFQNTGTAPAVNVILLDTVEADLDIASFQMRNASHDYHVQIEGREITWIFNDIMLPDSTTSADSSIGFVSFSMNAIYGLPDNSRVENSAGIYFDYNDVVATGTAFNTIDKATSIYEIAEGMDIALQPNPFTSYTNLVITGGGSSVAYTLRIYDVNGRILQQVTSPSNVIRIERNDMPQGLYMYEVNQGDKLIGKGKMIAE